MVEEEIDFVKLQSRKAGNFMVTIPKAIVETLGYEGKTKIKVLFDKERRRVIYQF